MPSTDGNYSPYGTAVEHWESVGLPYSKQSSKQAWHSFPVGDSTTRSMRAMLLNPSSSCIKLGTSSAFVATGSQQSHSRPGKSPEVP
ncbi:hypothetical protein BofuT4_P080470.1 [Botrytis cinerea T4]|uniref:Uncharacterized protein n=1 Tax=Botryotinia fuckeliana (strain T4) TaxID=999810 RepID=G2YKV4_BOTF4|nr:hypothetical protein BofuT4_P080470.1 [Botrytis cinerea T4]